MTTATETTSQPQCIAESIVAISIPNEIRAAFTRAEELRDEALEASRKFRSINLGLDKYQQRDLNHRMMDISQRYGYDHELVYKYLKAYGLKSNAYGERKVPYITPEWIEAQHVADVTNRVAQEARQAYEQYFRAEGAFAGETDISKAYRTIITAILKAEAND